MCLGPPPTPEQLARWDAEWAALPIAERYKHILDRFNDPRDRKWYAPRVVALLEELKQRAGI